MKRIAFLTILAAGILSGSAWAASVSGNWKQAGQNCPGIDTMREECTYAYTSNDSPILSASVTVTVCLNSDTAQDEAGVATAYVRYQPGGASPDENFSYRVTDADGADVQLSSSTPCVAVPPGNLWIESETACGATCNVVATGRGY